MCRFRARWLRRLQPEWAGFILLIVGVVLAFASTPARAQTVPSQTLAEVNGEAITAEELEGALGARLSQLEEQVYNLKRQELEALIAQRLLAQEAAKRRISVPALVDAEVTSKVGLVTEQEIETFYQANKARLKTDDPKIKEQIRAHLQNQKLAAQREMFLQSLRSKAKVAVHLPPPAVFRFQVGTDGALFKGAAEAAVTIVKFEDFHCPFCKQVQQTFAQLLSRYNKELRLVHRDFPIDSLHPQARKGHEAARCANDQGKFWIYHDRLYTNAPKAAPEDLKAYAEEAGLDLVVFERCLSGNVHQAAVQRDIDEGIRLGVTGTPAFFINGRALSGAQPLEAFTRVIDDELARVAGARGK